MNKKKRRLFFFYLPLCCAILGAIAWFLKPGPPPKSVASGDLAVVNVQADGFKALETIENQLKIQVGVDKLTNSEVVFHIIMESYQNTDAIDADPLETTILTIQNDIPFKPIHWAETSRDEYHREGYLTFSIAQKPSRLRLSIFELEERTFEWDLSGSQSQQP